nr:ATP-binding protein [Catalinimonas alkaloidigena]
MLAFFDRNRNWIKAKVGLQSDEAICANALNAYMIGSQETRGVVAVPDIQACQPYRDIACESPFRFYAGVPLITPGGHLIGSLCVLDHHVRELCAEHQFALEVMAKQVMNLLELRSKNQRLHRTLDQAQLIGNLGVYEIDLVNHRWFASEPFQKLFGLPPATSYPLDDFWKLIHQEDVGAQQLCFRTKLGVENKFDCEFRCVHQQTGKVFYVRNICEVIRNEAGRAVRMVGIKQDVSDQVATLMALQESEERWQFALEGAGDGVWDWTVGSETVFTSRQCKRMLGFEEHELGDALTDWLARILPSTPVEVERFTSSWNPKQERGLMKILQVRAKDGTIRWMLTRGKVVAWKSNGEPLRLIGTLSDITEHKMAEEALQERNTELTKANQELDNFVYRVSHDLRAPISSILGLIHLIKNETDLDVIQHYTQLAEQSLQKQDHFIRDILDYSRNTRLSLQPKEVDFQEMYEETLLTLNHTPEFKLVCSEVRVEAEAGVIFRTDPQRLNVVLNNLVANALRYMNPRQEHSYLQLSARVEAEKAVLCVRDNGIGIHPEHLDKVFRMFYRATDHKPGSGLGLYIVKETVEKLGGTVQIKSQPNVGTEFVITLPNLAPSETKTA